METSHLKTDFLRGFDKLTTRRGVSGMAVVFITAGLFIASVGFLSWKFKQSDLSVSQGFFGKTSALVSKTFGDMFSSGQDKPAAEIDLGERMTGGNGGEIKNTSSSPSFTKASEGSSHFESSQQTAKYSTEEKKKISENKNSFSPAENPTVQSSANGNNFPQTSELSSPALCDFTKTQTPNHKILFSEVAWMGSVKSASDEWIELKNNSGSDMSLAGWQILSDDENIKIIFDQNNFPVGAFYLLERSDDNSVPNISADKIYTGALSNDGVRLGIFNANCELADEIDVSKTWPAGDNATKKTMERSSLDLSWHASSNVGGTPRAENSAAFLTAELNQTVSLPAVNNTSTPATTSIETQTSSSTNNGILSSNSRVLISEIMAASDSDSNYEFVELYNLGTNEIDLTGWSLKKKSSTGSESSLVAVSRLQGKKIPPNKYFLLVNEAVSSTISNADVYWPKSYTLAHTVTNSVVIYDASSVKVDEVSWTEIPAGKSYVRDLWSSNSFSVSTAPTPQNSTSQ